MVACIPPDPGTYSPASFPLPENSELRSEKNFAYNDLVTIVFYINNIQLTIYDIFYLGARSVQIYLSLFYAKEGRRGSFLFISLLRKRKSGGKE